MYSEWMKRAAWKSYKIPKETASMKETFKRKNIKLMLISGPLRLTFKKISKNVLSTGINFNFLDRAPRKHAAKINNFLMLLEVLVVWFIWTVNWVCRRHCILRTDLSLFICCRRVRQRKNIAALAEIVCLLVCCGSFSDARFITVAFICLSSSSASDHEVITVALTEWFVCMRECRERASGASSIQHNSEII